MSWLSEPARTGLKTGLIAGLLMVVWTAMFRLVLGIPLPVELVSDRIIPELSIGQFSRLARLLGGLVVGKLVSFVIGFAVQLVVAAIGGLLVGMAVAREGRRTFPRPHDARVPARAVVALVVVLLLIWVVFMVALWPVLASNYRGLPPDPARMASALGFLFALLLYGGGLLVGYRLMAGAGEIHPQRTRGVSPGRRAFLLWGAGGVLSLAAGGFIFELLRRATVGISGYDGLRTEGPRIDPITPNDRFYVVTKNIIDPNIDRGIWRLDVIGEVERAHTYRFEEFAALPSVTQLQTLECISNSVGGGLMSNAAWRGVPLRTLVESARPKPGAKQVVLHAADGYVHAVSLDKAMEPTTLVAYEMNGVPLPERHGYPARILVPGTYGEVSVKWVDRIELVAEPVEGYYERQGWRPWFVHTTSRFDRPTAGHSFSLARDPMIDLGGVAFAGDRGIARVEVSVDERRTWLEAGIDYQESPLSWSLWSYPWQPAGPGDYTLAVRATDGTGALQDSTRRGVAPSGATGLHMISVLVED
jgi:DMSO/TMAO reductase YedYZ molybdopterin-dependent catalytic subunit